MRKTPLIHILMATYHGERYLREQIDSLLQQTEQDFVLYAQDDCSTDGTYGILCDYASRYPEKVHVERNVANSGGAKYNFLSLMEKHRQAEYCMLCDQDDVWLPDKIAVSLSAIRGAEACYGKQTPLLAHTDLTVVDAACNPIHPSFVGMQGILTAHQSLRSITICNTVTGCAAVYNRALAELIRMPSYCEMHDHWLAMTAAAFGQIRFVPQATVLYRQHGGNTLGAKDAHSLWFEIDKVLGAKRIQKSLFSIFQQAGAFANTYADLLNEEQMRFLHDVGAIPMQGKIRRWQEINRLKEIKSSWPRKLGQLFYI